MSDRHVVATTMLIAGIMLGAFTVQLKNQGSLHLGTLGLGGHHEMLGYGAMNGRRARLLRLT